ncbi:hypothetical protein IFT84_20680 [Rhizobium sp. CFBP 8762]|uniref:hypothetical protein n=1 Tax=Rhizobium sp. CFBP 8762 TaxID=2775279 RepID=UPI0017853CEA|nr:hypothetical protein [Rhizobium sp. CFBP 8762]MBD8556929.1 hypothetical protein [Rhizobium sp. CFBP 8762]
MTDFAAALQELKDHHINNIKQGKRRYYVPSERVRKFYELEINVSNDNKDIIELQNLSQDLGQQQSNDNRTAISSSTEAYQNAGATPAAQSTFSEQLEKQRQAAIEQAVDHVNKIYDKAAIIAEKHPDLQPLILSTLDTISKLFEELYNKLSDFISGVIDTIVEWLDHAWKTIKDTFNAFTSWISHWF